MFLLSKFNRKLSIEQAFLMLGLATLLVFPASIATAGDRDLPVEICANAIDDDSDGDVDEAQCLITADSAPISGGGIIPELWNDNPRCENMGYGFGFKTDGCVSGTYYLTSAYGELTGGAMPDPDAYLTIACEDGEARLVDWSTSLAMDAVFIKGGPLGGNLYNYSPEAFGDTGLGTPDTGNAISHIEFCYDYELDVSKTADGSFDRVYTWTIQKDYDGSYDKNIGDPATNHGYQVSVDQTITEGGFAVTGSIEVTNPTPFDTTIEAIDDVLSDGTVATVSCGVTFPYVLAADSSLGCTYVAAPGDAGATVNTATVTTSGFVDGGTATAPISFAANIVGYPTINVTDTNGQGWAAGGDATWNYSRDFVCSSNPADYTGGFYTFDHVNTATITETTQSDDATVTVNCYAPLVSKTANGTLDREYEWQITKGDDATYNDFIGDPANPHTYSITVTKTGEYTDSNWMVDGSITVSNPGTLPMALSSVTDSVNGAVAVVDCPTMLVAPGGSLECTYTASDGLTGDETLNTATATLNGFGFTGTAAVSYQVDNETNTEVNVTDVADGDTQNFGPYTETTTFTYDHDFQCPTDVGAYSNAFFTTTRLNTATIDETGDSDDATVTLNCYAPVVTKTAAGVYDERHDWDIEKTVDPESAGGFVGENMSWTWTVTLSETSVDENWAVTGDITVANAHPTEAMTITDLVDSINGVPAAVSCSSYLVPASGSLVCSYSATADDGLDGDETLNVATATFNNIDFSGQKAFTYEATVINGTADVVDDREGDFPITVNVGEGPWEWTETEEDVCSTNVSLYDGDGAYDFTENNTATVTGSEGQSDSADASTTITCYAPIPTKDADTSYVREFTWTIAKNANPTSHVGFPGDTFQSAYDVAVDQTMEEYDFAVFGTITVQNPRPDLAMTVSVSDFVGGGAATLDCGGTLEVPAGGSATCGYSKDLAAKVDGTNTATVTLNTVDFNATADYAFGDPDDVIGYETVDVTDTQPDSTAPWQTSGDDSWHYFGDFECPTDTGLYTDGIYTHTVPNTAEITQTGQADDQDVDITCYIPVSASVIKTTSEGPEDIGQFPLEFGLFAPGADATVFGNNTETGQLFAAGTVTFTTELKEEGTWTIVELLPDGWVNDVLTCTFDVEYPAAANQVFECTFDNTEMSRIDLLKLTNGIYDPNKIWTFNLFEGPDGFDGTLVATDSTPTDPADAGLLKFGNTNLDPGATYTLCEQEVPAGYSAFWQLDTDGDGIGDAGFIPYNPNADDDPPEDLGNRCVDIGSNSGIPLTPGVTLHFIVDNRSPGGGPRTPGYWKNWNRCTGGGQQFTADTNGGWQEGFWLLEDVLDPIIGGGITWDDILSDDFLFEINLCAVAVDILDKRQVDDPAIVGDGRKKASDALHNLATHLMAAQLNFGAGACIPDLDTIDINQVALEAEELLDEYNFDGDGHDNLNKKHPDARLANELATYLDRYNNGEFCGDSVE